MKVKAISLWEPYASLIRTGAKTWETRSWATSYRGPLLICAAKGGLSKYDLLDTICHENFQNGLAPLIGLPINYNGPEYYHGIGPQHLNFGKAVSLVELINCESVNNIDIGDIGHDRYFGDFSLSRYAWKLKMINNNFEPFPVKGRQGFFEVELPKGIRI